MDERWAFYLRHEDRLKTFWQRYISCFTCLQSGDLLPSGLCEECETERKGKQHLIHNFKCKDELLKQMIDMLD